MLNGEILYSGYLDHGFVALVDVMGSDGEICDAARTSYGKGTRSVSDNRALIRHLVRHQHTSPIEMGEVKFHLKVPIFVMRQLVRHRSASLNEYSARYSEMTDEMYMPKPNRFQSQSTTNKQGSGDILDEEERKECEELLRRSYTVSYMNYLDTLEQGLTRELARIQLPVANYTQLYWKIDLKNFFHFVKLRTDPHAQKEIQDLANIMYEFVKPYFPLACEAFEDYWKNAITLSSNEHKVMLDLLASMRQDYGAFFFKSLIKGAVDDENNGLSKREKDEFLAKFDFREAYYGN